MKVKKLFWIILVSLTLLLQACNQSSSSTTVGQPQGIAPTPNPTTANPATQNSATIGQTRGSAPTPNAPIQNTPLSTLPPFGKVTPAERVETRPNTNNGEPVVLRFVDFYAPNSNTQLSEKMLAAKDKTVKIVGYMAPPLKPDLDFFVLTKIRLAVCPFCSKEAEWPNDIILVTLANGKTFQQTEEPLVVIGKLEVGGQLDKETGFYSLLRLRAENIDVFKG
jgi:hypothetical protein